MAENPNRTVYIGNLDERVSDRVLYDILIQAGPVVDLHVPRDKETNKPKGFAFAEYETEESADYAVKLFTGLVTLYKRTLKFAISGQDKPLPNLAAAAMPVSNSPPKNSPYMQHKGLDVPQHSMKPSTPSRFSSQLGNYDQGHEPNGYKSQCDGQGYDYARRVFGATLDSFSRSRLGRYNSSTPMSHPYS